MIDKTTTLDRALAGIASGITLMVGGFGVPGTPFALIDRVLDSGVTGLTLIKNEANLQGMGVSKLLEAGRVARLITSHIGLNPVAVRMMHAREIEVEFNAQGILAERIRAGGAGLLAVVSDIGVDTVLAQGKPSIRVDGRRGLLETALRADVALVHAAVADRWGNLIFDKSARNFNPVMATAADRVIVECERLVEPGRLVPDQIHTPGAFVDAVVELSELGPEYGILEEYVLESGP